MSNSHRSRVDDWMASTLQAEVPPLPPKHLTMADVQTQPYKFYRRTYQGGSTMNSHNGSQSARRHEEVLPDHLQMSSTKYQTESQRLLEWENSSDRLNMIGKDSYNDPMVYDFRSRDRSKELGGPLRFKPIDERQRIQDAITERDIGGRTFPYEEAKPFPTFREENKEKWKAGPFTGRLPSLPVFSRPPPSTEPYVDSVSPDYVFRPTATSEIPECHTERWKSYVPTDRFVPLPPSSARGPKPPVNEVVGQHILSAGLNSTGIYTLKAQSASANNEEKVNGAASSSSDVPLRKSFWKSAITLAHQPPTHTPRGDTDAAQQLYRTYRRHLAY